MTPRFPVTVLLAVLVPLVAAAAATPDTPKITDLKIDGERWTCEADGKPLDGILLKPEGKGPFAAVLISHGLGGAAESFGLNKAREFVLWNMVCIAPNYTHNARAAGARPKGAKGGGPDAKGRPGGHSADFGASVENIHRAKACIAILRSLPGVDAERIAAYGHSMGGFVTIGLAAASPGLLKAAAITGSGIAPRAGFPAPSAEAAGKIRTPFLILHGGADPVVRPEQSAALKDVLDRNGVTNERRVFEGEGHPIDQTKRAEVFATIREWFAKHGALKP